MGSKCTITGKVGIGASISATKLEDATELHFDLVRHLLLVTLGSQRPIREIDISAATTFTITKSGNDYSLTVS